MNNQYLVYINKVGVNYLGNNIYEFLFASDIEEIDGEDWNIYPASIGNVSPPELSLLSSVAKVETDIDLSVINDSDTFSVWDATDGVIALAYEDISEYDEYPDSRLVFSFGEPLESVQQTLFSREITLDLKEIDIDEN
jgi:hypothetical protein